MVRFIVIAAGLASLSVAAGVVLALSHAAVSDRQPAVAAPRQVPDVTLQSTATETASAQPVYRRETAAPVVGHTAAPVLDQANAVSPTVTAKPAPSVPAEPTPVPTQDKAARLATARPSQSQPTRRQAEPARSPDYFIGVFR